MTRIIVLSLLIVYMGLGCGGPAREDSGPGRQTAKAGPLFRCFTTKAPGKEVIKCAYADLNNDGREDMVVIYRASKTKNAMCVIMDLQGGCVATNEMPAPASKQMIEFRDIDRKPPMEFVVHGMKGMRVGYAVFRVERGRLVDLFGHGMADCC